MATNTGRIVAEEGGAAAAMADNDTAALLQADRIAVQDDTDETAVATNTGRIVAEEGGAAATMADNDAATLLQAVVRSHIVRQSSAVIQMRKIQRENKRVQRVANKLSIHGTFINQIDTNGSTPAGSGTKMKEMKLFDGVGEYLSEHFIICTTYDKVRHGMYIYAGIEPKSLDSRVALILVSRDETRTDAVGHSYIVKLESADGGGSRIDVLSMQSSFKLVSRPESGEKKKNPSRYFSGREMTKIQRFLMCNDVPKFGGKRILLTSVSRVELPNTGLIKNTRVPCYDTLSLYPATKFSTPFGTKFTFLFYNLNFELRVGPVRARGSWSETDGPAPACILHTHRRRCSSWRAAAQQGCRQRSRLEQHGRLRAYGCSVDSPRRTTNSSWHIQQMLKGLSSAAPPSIFLPHLG
eukprot:SAG31_NODE_3_length_45830_cov_42.279701_42_plen_410_part_00